MTRETDRFVALRARFEMARQDHADMFISLHCDSDPGDVARGATVYTLSETASDAEAAALAAKENKADLINGVDLSQQNNTVTSILIDLAQRETKNRSAAFAELLVHDMGQVTMMQQNSHRYAGFAVLKAPDIPSVLIELGYLSDPQDEALLISPQHRTKWLVRCVSCVSLGSCSLSERSSSPWRRSPIIWWSSTIPPTSRTIPSSPSMIPRS
jgi:N-acetylmuramoyl-L-alanine amidase